MFEWLTNLFHKSPDVAEIADQGIQKAQEITTAIPGDADNQVVQAVEEKVQQVTEHFEQIKENVPETAAAPSTPVTPVAPVDPAAAPTPSATAPANDQLKQQ